MLVWDFVKGSLGFLGGLFVVDSPVSHRFPDPLSGFRGGRLSVVDFLSLVRGLLASCAGVQQ